MRAYDLMKRFEALSGPDRKYVFQYFLGMVSMDFEGYINPGPYKFHAEYTLNELEKSIKMREK